MHPSCLDPLQILRQDEPTIHLAQFPQCLWGELGIQYEASAGDLPDLLGVSQDDECTGVPSNDTLQSGPDRHAGGQDRHEMTHSGLIFLRAAVPARNGARLGSGAGGL